MIDWNSDATSSNSTGSTKSAAEPIQTSAIHRSTISAINPAPASLTSVPALKELIRSCLETSLGEVEQLIGSSIISRHPEVQQLATQANGMAGKRLRPILVLLSAQAVATQGRHQFEHVRRNLLRIATATELIHMASLVHDDVMDLAETRRHLPTVGRTAGTHSAILLGDYLFTKAYATASSCRSPYPARKLAAAASQLCEGELRQQMSAHNFKLNIHEYLSIIGQKTASLCAVSCRLGAWQVAAAPDVQRSLYRFGKLLGLAFQVFDDWLDYWGNHQAGKTLGSDLALLKPTLPLIKFLQTCSTSAKQQLILWASSNDADQRELAYDMIRRSDAGEKTLSMAHNLIDRAQLVLQKLPESSARVALHEIASFSIQRSA